MSEKTTILCIDDDNTIRFALSRLFTLQGWECLEAENSECGLAVFEKERPDLVLVDYHMPGENGIETVKKLRQRSLTTPIIVFTIEESQKTADEFLEAGATDFATKPIKAPDIISRVRLHLKMLEQQKARQTEQPQMPSQMPASRVEKGMSEVTMDVVLHFLSEAGEPKTVEEIAAGTGLANPTTYRYLQYLVREEKALMEVDYGKIGRPKQRYRLK